MLRLFLIFILVISTTLNCSYCSDSQEDVIINNSKQYMMLDDYEEVKNLDKRVANLYKDIEGYEDDYLRCELFMCRFSGTLSKTASKILIISSALMTGLIAVPGILDDQTKAIVGTAATVCNLTSVAFLSFKLYSDKEVDKRKARLIDAILNNDNV